MHETAAASIAANAMLMTFARLGSKVALFKTFCNYQVHPLIVIFHTLIILLWSWHFKKKSVYVIRLDVCISEGSGTRKSGFRVLEVLWRNGF